MAIPRVKTETEPKTSQITSIPVLWPTKTNLAQTSPRGAARIHKYWPKYQQFSIHLLLQQYMQLRYELPGRELIQILLYASIRMLMVWYPYTTS